MYVLRLPQVSYKGDSVGWGAYEICRKHGGAEVQARPRLERPALVFKSSIEVYVVSVGHGVQWDMVE